MAENGERWQRDRQLDKEKRKKETMNLQRFLPNPLRSYL